MTDIKIDVGEIIGRVKAMMTELYPDSRAIKVDLVNIELMKGLSEPYGEGAGDEFMVVANYVKIAKFSIQCEVQHKYSPFKEGFGGKEK